MRWSVVIAVGALTGGCVHRASTGPLTADTAEFLAREAVDRQWGWGHDPSAAFQVIRTPEDRPTWAVEARDPRGEQAVVLVSLDARQISVHPLWCEEDGGARSLLDLNVVTDARLDALAGAVPRRLGKAPITVGPETRSVFGRACCPIPVDPPPPDRHDRREAGLARRSG